MEGVVVLIIKITITYMLPLSSLVLYKSLAGETPVPQGRDSSPSGERLQSLRGETPVPQGRDSSPSGERLQSLRGETPVPQGRDSSPSGERLQSLRGETLVPPARDFFLLRQVHSLTQASGIKYARFNWSIVRLMELTASPIWLCYCCEVIV
ncbi:hypothetical protein IX315_000203 [Porphyromonas levii]|nr:hypothetical protein [Porphyromonas levii]